MYWWNTVWNDIYICIICTDTTKYRMIYTERQREREGERESRKRYKKLSIITFKFYRKAKLACQPVGNSSRPKRYHNCCINGESVNCTLSSHNGQWCTAVVLSLLLAWTNYICIVQTAEMPMIQHVTVRKLYLTWNWCWVGCKFNISNPQLKLLRNSSVCDEDIFTVFEIQAWLSESIKWINPLGIFKHWPIWAEAPR